MNADQIMKYSIGQNVWVASFESTEKRVTCEDCGGTKILRVILFDGTEHTIECAGCSRGWAGARGFNTVYDRIGMALPTVVLGAEIDGEKVSYRTATSYRVEDSDIFLSEEEAQTRAREIAASHNAAELDQLHQKEKPARSWSWHVHYHRSEIRRLEKSLEHHRSKLGIARTKSKE